MPSTSTLTEDRAVGEDVVEPVDSAGPEDNDSPPRDHVQSLSRGLMVICAFGADAPQMTVSQASERTGLSRATVRRSLLTLVDDGYAVSDGKYFALAPKILEAGYAFLSSMPFWDVAQPLIEEATRTIGEACSAAVLDGNDVVFVYVSRPQPVRVLALNLSVGSRAPAFATALGRVMLADLLPEQLETFLTSAQLPKLTRRTITEPSELRLTLDRVREQGWSLADEELEMGLRSIAVPIRDSLGHVAAALNVTCHSSRTTSKQMISEYLPVLQEIARRLSTAPMNVTRRNIGSAHVAKLTR